MSKMMKGTMTNFLWGGPLDEIMEAAEEYAEMQVQEMADLEEHRRLQEDELVAKIMCAAQSVFPEALHEFLEYRCHDESGYYPTGGLLSRPPYAEIYLRIPLLAPIRICFELYEGKEGLELHKMSKSRGGGYKVIEYEAVFDDIGDDGWNVDEYSITGRHFDELVPALACAQQLGNNFEAIDTECVFRNNAEKHVQGLEAAEAGVERTPVDDLVAAIQALVRKEVEQLGVMGGDEHGE